MRGFVGFKRKMLGVAAHCSKAPAFACERSSHPTPYEKPAGAALRATQRPTFLAGGAARQGARLAGKASVDEFVL